MPWFKCNNTCHDLSVIIHAMIYKCNNIHAMIYKCNNICHDLSVIIHAMIYKCNNIHAMI